MQMQPFLRVCDILNRPVFAAADLVAGASGLERAVRWVHILDISEPLAHIRGGELILTTGLGFGGDVTRFCSFVEQLVAGRAAGLCVELGTTVQVIPEDVRTFAEKSGLPLIVFPQKVRFVDITQDVHKLILMQERQAFFEQDWVEQWLRQDGGDNASFDQREQPSSRPLGADKGERSKATPAGKAYRVALLKIDDSLVDADSAGLPSDLATDWFDRRSELSLAVKNAFAQHGIRSYLSVRADVLVAVLERDLRRADALGTTEWSDRIGPAFESLSHALKRSGWESAPCMGVGSEACERTDVHRSYADAKTTLAICEQVQGTGWMTCEETGIYQWVAMLSLHPEANYSAKRTLLPILDFDRRHHTHLLDTLKVYLDCDRSKQQTADALFIHRQTLYHRLEQLEQLLPIDLNDPVARLFLHVSIYYHLFHQRSQRPGEV